MSEIVKLKDKSNNDIYLDSNYIVKDEIKLNNVLDGYTLYDNESGTTSDITLSDDISNYKYLEVYSDNGYTKVDLAITNTFYLRLTGINNSYMQIETNTYTIDGTSISVVSSFVSIYATSITTSEYNAIKIYKIIGYK